MAIDIEKIRAAIAPAVADLDLELYDVEFTGAGRSRVLRVTVNQPDGVTIGKLTDVNHALDKLTDELITGAFELEVTSPGIERNLRRREHYNGAIGETISIKHSALGAMVRDRGRLDAATDTGIIVLLDNGEERTVSYDAISAARTVFRWGPAPRPGSKASRVASGRKEPANS